MLVQLFDMRTGDGEVLLPAPVNAMPEPHRRDTDKPGGSIDIPVIARLVWPRDRIQLVPARALRWTRDRVLVYWWPDPRVDRTRATWLPIGDVQTTLRWIERRSAPPILQPPPAFKRPGWPRGGR